MKQSFGDHAVPQLELGSEETVPGSAGASPALGAPAKKLFTCPKKVSREAGDTTGGAPALPGIHEWLGIMGFYLADPVEGKLATDVDREVMPFRLRGHQLRVNLRRDIEEAIDRAA